MQQLHEDTSKYQLKVSAGKEMTPISKESSVGFVLVFASGWLNIVGLRYAFFDSVSYVSGRGIRIGMAMFDGDLFFLAVALGTLLSFIFGGYVGAILTRRLGIGSGLLVSAAAVICSGVIFAMTEINAFEASEAASYLSMHILPFATGCMNASTSMTGIGRTTHLTGPATDIGMSLAAGKKKQAAYWCVRWLGFIMGAFMAMLAFAFMKSNRIPAFFMLIVPALLIGAEGIQLLLCPDAVPVNRNDS